MHAETDTRLSLYEWARIIGVHPLHFAGVDIAELDSQHPNCRQAWVQYEWQGGDRVGRESVARAIAQAESDMEANLGFRLMPVYERTERDEAIQLYNPEWFAPSRRFKANYGYLLEGGCLATEALTIEQQMGGSPPGLVDILWQDDSYWQKGSVLVPIAEGTDLESLHIYYPDHAGDPLWEIRPIVVTLDDPTTARVSFRRECAVIEALWNGLVATAANGMDDADFLTTVEVQRHYTDASCSVTFRWTPDRLLCTCGGTGTCVGCSIRTQAGCLTIEDEKLGLISTRAGTWADDTFTPGYFSYGRRPDSVDLNYRGGYQDFSRPTPTRTMDPTLARAVAYYAAALLERAPCDCTANSWARWRSIRGTHIGNAPDIEIRQSLIHNTPFGPWEGAIYAWDRVAEYSLGGALLPK